MIAIERELLELYRDPTLDRKPELLERRGGAYYSEAAAALIESLHTGDGAVHVVDVRNDGAIPNLPDDAVVEVPARIDRDGADAAPDGAARARDARARPARQGVRATDDRGGAPGDDEVALPGAARQPARPGAEAARGSATR